MKLRILVAGSSNTDMVIQTSHFPKPGETVMGSKFFMNPGGKGANQAVAAARLGGSVTFLAKTGNDLFGKQSQEMLQNEGINTSYILTDPIQASGIALITVNEQGENSIVVASGANSTLLPQDFHDSKEIIESNCIFLLQLEIPLATVDYIIQIAHARGATVILNPSPVLELKEDLLSRVSILIVNASEAAYYSGLPVTGKETALAAAHKLKAAGVEKVVITLGREGVLLLDDLGSSHISAPVVEAVDTTAAGDVFAGALALCLSESRRLRAACEFAVKAAAISVTRLGAIASAPYRREVECFDETIAKSGSLVTR